MNLVLLYNRFCGTVVTRALIFFDLKAFSGRWYRPSSMFTNGNILIKAISKVFLNTFVVKKKTPQPVSL